MCIYTFRLHGDLIEDRSFQGLSFIRFDFVPKERYFFRVYDENIFAYDTFDSFQFHSKVFRYPPSFRFLFYFFFFFNNEFLNKLKSNRLKLHDRRKHINKFL